jgi:endonuclease/exonuclease/phosphatase family metal-dependent hydrolase
MNWNAAGAKFLASPSDERPAMRGRLKDALKSLTDDHSPDVVVLQEVARYGTSGVIEDLVVPPADYHYACFVAIDTVWNSHPSRWERIRRHWHPDDYLAQGYGILWRKDLRHASVWDDTFNVGARIDAEVVHLNTGLYTGSRDTEPRLAVVTHFLKEPIEFFVVNIHLVTLLGERIGVPVHDAAGSRLRVDQVDLVLNGIVSRYNDWRNGRTPNSGRTRRPPVWVLSGDFNAIPESPEVRRIQQLNFLDLNPSKGAGTKAKGIGQRPTLAVDYIFAGPEFVAFDPFLGRELARQNNVSAFVDARTIGVSDHYPIVAEVPVT